MKKYILYLITFLFGSCVTPRVHNDLLNIYNETSKKLIDIEKQAMSLNSNIQENQEKINTLKKNLDILKNDSVQNGKSLSVLKSKHAELNTAYDMLVSKNSRYMAEKATETKKLLEQLEQNKMDLLVKEDQLNVLSNSLKKKEDQLQLSQIDLLERSKRVMELESLISRKDSLVTVLKQSISKALIGLEGEGLTVIQKNGKVYVSLEEDLLFESGKYEINNEGIIALNKLAAVLANENRLEILVEGHTDSIALSGKGLIKDNWDLSVIRATSVVKILLKNPSLNPLQLTAAGRADFVPIESNKTTSGRSANRRIEMILSPNLDDLFKLLNN